MKSSRPRLGLALLVIVVLLFLVKSFVIDVAVVAGRSMLPTLGPGRVVFVLRCAYGLRLPFGGSYLTRWSDPALGDVVAARSPRDGGLVVKRVGRIFEDGSLELLGDNPRESLDSRSYGPLPVEALMGRVLLYTGFAER